MHSRALTHLLDGVLPLACPGCGCAVGASAPVCRRCAPGLRRPPLVPPPRPLDAWWALFAYDGVARELVARIKYRRAHAVVRWLGVHMAGLVGPPLPDVVTWAPTTAARCRERGFDHAALLAREVGRGLHRPARGLLRRADGPPQTGRPAHERRHGPRFGPAAAAPPTVLLVDDVATTGATLAAAAAALLDAGAVRVVGLTAARTL